MEKQYKQAMERKRIELPYYNLIHQTSKNQKNILTQYIRKEN